MNRRALLASLAAGTVSLAGCLSGSDATSPDGEAETPTDTDGTATPTPGGPETPTDTPTPDDWRSERTNLPENCPTSRNLGVEWPETLDADAVVPFVEAYERAYYREVVVEYEPRSALDEYELSGRVTSPPEREGYGWVLEYTGGGAIYRPTLLMGATRTEPPAGADVVPVSEIDDSLLTTTLEEAARTGEAEQFVDTPGSTVDEYVDLLASLSADFDRLSERGDSDTLYADVDGTVVELSVEASSFHGDYGWDSRYYVDEHVVRRTADGTVHPRNGELLECRPPD